MVVDELITRFQRLSDDGHGSEELLIALSTRPPRVGYISRVVAPSPAEADPEDCEPEARSSTWLIAGPTDVDGMPYASEYFFE